jgi:hypothetical protein
MEETLFFCQHGTVKSDYFFLMDFDSYNFSFVIHVFVAHFHTLHFIMQGLIQHGLYCLLLFHLLFFCSHLQ